MLLGLSHFSNSHFFRDGEMGEWGKGESLFQWGKGDVRKGDAFI